LYRDSRSRYSYRVLSPDQQRRINAKLLPFAGTNFDLVVVTDVPEAMNLRDEINDVLRVSGWKWRPIGPGTVLGQGVTVKASKGLAPAANALSDALAVEGIPTVQMIGETPDPAPNRILVIIGRKE
jgi:hypothetical protein